MNLARLGNKYLADTEPWKLQHTNKDRVETIMNISIQIAGSLSVLCKPFMPFTSIKLNNMLNLSKEKWKDAGMNIIPNEHQINKGIHLFEKIEDAKIKEQLSKLTK